jgi:hypothetical protein
MEWPFRRRWLSVALLGVILPIALFAAFKLGEAPEEITTETFAAEAVNLSVERPSESTNLPQQIQNEWTYDGTKVVLGVTVYEYRENSDDLPYDGNDGLVFQIHANASFTHGNTDHVTITFHLLEGNASLFIDTNPWSLQAHNANILDKRIVGTNEVDAYIIAQPQLLSYSVETQIFWVFLDENSENHQMQVTVKVVHQNGTTRKIITVPITLEMHLSTGGD